MDGRFRFATMGPPAPPGAGAASPSGTWSPGHSTAPQTVIPVTGTTEPGAPHHAFHGTPRPDDDARPWPSRPASRRRGPAPASAATWAPRTSQSFDPQRDLDEFESRILIRVNRARERRGLSKVRVFQSCVDGYSERWSQKLRSSGEMVHRDLGAVLDGCDLNWVGENLVSGTDLRPRAAVRAWMDSPAAPPGADEAPRGLGRRRRPGRQATAVRTPS